MNASREVEIAVHISKQVADRATVLNLLEHHQFKVVTQSCYAGREGLVLLLIVNQPTEARQILEKAGYRCGVNSVLLIGTMRYSPGVAAQLCMEFTSQGIIVLYTYLFSSTEEGHCFIVVSTSDNDRALLIARHEAKMVAA